MITRYFPLTLTLNAPLILAGLESDPNSAESLTFIPGSTLRGAVARALCLRGVDRSAPEEFRRLVLSGQVRYLNAYRSVTGQRSLPVPLSLRREKHGDRVIDLAGLVEWPDGCSARLAASYMVTEGDDLMEGEVATTGRTHHQRDRRSGRPTATTGAIFRFEAVDAGQEFQALLAVGGSEEASVNRDAATLQEALGATVLLGRSRRAGYGGAARLTWGTPRDREGDSGRLAIGDQSAGTVLRVLLTSDYLGRHPVSGQVDPGALAVELRRRLGERLEVQQRFHEFRPVGGYNRTWGLELPQGLAVKAGSVVLVRLTQLIPMADLLAVEHAGLGERRAEGFGRFLFLTLTQAETKVKPVAVEEVSLPSVTPPPLLQTLQRRLLDEAVEQRIAEAAASLAATASHIPSRSLLGQLRVPLRRPPHNALGELRSWLDGLRKPARRALQGCRIFLPSPPLRGRGVGGEGERRPQESPDPLTPDPSPPSTGERGDRGGSQSLETWLTETAAVESDLAALLGYADLAQRHRFSTVEAARATLDNPGFATRTRLHLIDAVLAALTQKSAQSGEE